MSAAEPSFAFTPNPRLNFGPSIWPLVNELVAAHPGTVNLGQGFPDEAAPFVTAAAADAIVAGQFTYARSQGALPLVRALAESASRSFPDGRAIDPEREVTVCVGGCEALCCAVLACVDVGSARDQVVFFEPAFDCYSKQAALVGASAVPVAMRPAVGTDPTDSANWEPDWAQAEAALCARTAVVIVNSPQNPLGKVWRRDECERLLALVRRCAPAAVIVSDEVYEHQVLEGTHVRFAALDGAWDRTLTVGSAGKTFGVTGYKVGWLIGAAPLVHAAWLARQWMSFCVATPLQHAIAVGLELAVTAHSGYFESVRTTLRTRRDALAAALLAAGLAPIAAHGSYFIFTRIPPAFLATHGLEATAAARGADVAVCEFLIARVGVACIPAARPFYSAGSAGDGSWFVRFCFCKSDATMGEAVRRLTALGSGSAGRAPGETMPAPAVEGLRPGPGFAVLYRWRLREDKADSFAAAWTVVSAELKRKGSLGSRLHRGPDDVWYSYAQWPSADVRAAAFALPQDSPAARAAMHEAVIEQLPEIELQSVSDLLSPVPKS